MFRVITRKITAKGWLLLPERPRQFVAAHLGTACEVAALGDAHELGAGLRARSAGALALGDRRPLLAQRRPRLLRHVGDRLLSLGGADRLPDVALGRLPLL